MARLRPRFIGSVLVLISVIGTGQVCAQTQSTSIEGEEYFEKKVRPLLVEHCNTCHSVDAKKLQAGLRLDSREGLLHGGDSGAAIVPGDPDASLLIEAVRYESYEMPPEGKLPTEDIETLQRWVEMGAPWPNDEVPEAALTKPDFDLQQRKSEHWVWQPIQTPAIPSVVDTSWPRDELDNFVLAKLDEAGLRPASDADRTAILRRLYFDLIGLPPTPTQTRKFLDDSSPHAIERLVDELLDSPYFGERWGRHWLDLVRYAESRGHEFDNDAPNAFQYRDYIIRAFNADVPYDQLVLEHIAGDLLPEPRLNSTHGYNESILGTGFWFLGEWVHSPVDIRKDETDRFDNMIDVMSKTFLGVTVACARCHDHKFDAISTADYYSLCGFLQSSDFRQVPFESLEHNRRIFNKLTELDAKYRQKISEVLSQSAVTSAGSKTQFEGNSPCIVVDYSLLSPAEFMQDGFVFGDRPRFAGQPYLAMAEGKPCVRFATATAAQSDSFWNGLEAINEPTVQNKSQLFSLPCSGRTLRTPTFTLTSGNVACRVQGSGHVVACVDSHRLIAGPLHKETIRPIASDQEWVELELDRYVGHRVHLEFTPAEGIELQVRLVTQGASSETRERLSQHEKLVADAVQEFSLAANQTHGKQLRHIARKWSAERTELRTQVMLRSHLAMAMMDGTGEDDHVLIRGNSSKPGDSEPRHFLTALTGGQRMAIFSGSGRLELARHINDSSNPLTPRVIVNRIWHYLMGRGIVATTDDFGVLGQRPTHPELLDHLASRFIEDGRSIKRMIRAIVLSRTYRMSSCVEAVLQEDSDGGASGHLDSVDPNNLLWHHRPPKRLEGEAIRDALLSISGRLDPAQFGESVPIHLTEFMDGRGRPNSSGPLDGDGRRSIYVAVRRNFLSPFMLTFDTPAPFSTMGRRNVSNVPAQALILMNDPLVVELAASWAGRAIKEASTTTSRVEWMYRSAFARLPTESEKTVAANYVSSQIATRHVDQNDQQMWSDFAHALINTKEFIFLR